jgi:F-type H+-transporting ATPase subunit alpha
MQAFLKSKYSELLDSINESGAYDDDVEAQMKAAIEDFKATSSW